MEPKRLYKGHTRMIAGVCSGIAEYFDVDPTLVRLAAVVLAFAGTAGFWAYLVCAIVIPNPPN
ncbi:PspC domain-containing protein [Ruminococcaceae bacterium OttesenSCG-928-A16]|nr:PspC domain-containing protein [Ruminococcaceae bacterium OttesenSCG-928-A16]